MTTEEPEQRTDEDLQEEKGDGSDLITRRLRRLPPLEGATSILRSDDAEPTLLSQLFVWLFGCSDQPDPSWWLQGSPSAIPAIAAADTAMRTTTDACQAGEKRVEPWIAYEETIKTLVKVSAASGRYADTWASSPFTTYNRIGISMTSPQARRDIRHDRSVTLAVFRYTLVAIFIPIMLAHLVAYALVRMCITCYEEMWVWCDAKAQELRDRLHSACSYAEWLHAARDLDEYLGLERRRAQSPTSSYYDAETIARIAKALNQACTRVDDVQGDPQSHPVQLLKSLRDLQREVLHSGAVIANIGGCDDRRLWSQTFSAKAKQPIYDYVDATCRSLGLVAASPFLASEEKRGFFCRAQALYGRAALSLTGAASRAFYHLGVVKALLEHGALPSVITGSSSGSIIAAFVCTHTDDEVEAVLRSDLAPLIWLLDNRYASNTRRLFVHGHFLDPVRFIQALLPYTNGSMTFREAYERTGRILSISVSPFRSPFVKAHALNHLNAPDVVIWSAVLASCSLPGVLPPALLMQKTPAADLEPFIAFGKWWVDGSLTSNTHFHTLQTMFNVQYVITSMVSPYVTLFWLDSKGAAGDPVVGRGYSGYRGGLVLGFAEKIIKATMLLLLRRLDDFDLLPMISRSRLALPWRQRLDGTVNIVMKDGFPRDTLPIPLDREAIERYIEKGQRQAWPHINMIKCRMRIENAIRDGLERSAGHAST